LGEVWLELTTVIICHASVDLVEVGIGERGSCRIDGWLGGIEALSAYPAPPLPEAFDAF